MNKLFLLIVLFCVCSIAVQGRLGLTAVSSLAVHKKSRARGLSKVPKFEDTTKLKKIKSLQTTEAPAETPAKSSLNRQKTLQGAMQLGLSLLSMFLSGKIRKLDYTNKNILQACRIGYLGYLVVCYALNLLLVHRIKKANNQTILPQKVDPMSLIMNMMLNKPSKPEQSVMEYDLEEASKMLRSLVFEIGMILVAHGILKYNAPLLLLPMMQLTSKLQNPLVLIHLLGFKAIDTLQRPFQSGFERFLSTIQPTGNSSGPNSAAAGTESDSSTNVDAANDSEASIASPQEGTSTTETISEVEVDVDADSTEVEPDAATGSDSEESIEVVSETGLDEDEEDEEEVEKATR